MLFKRIMGFVYLAAFLGFMTYKFSYYVTDQQDSLLIIALVILILLILLLAIRKILLH